MGWSVASSCTSGADSTHSMPSGPDLHDGLTRSYVRSKSMARKGAAPQASFNSQTQSEGATMPPQEDRRMFLAFEVKGGQGRGPSGYAMSGGSLIGNLCVNNAWGGSKRTALLRTNTGAGAAPAAATDGRRAFTVEKQNHATSLHTLQNWSVSGVGIPHRFKCFHYRSLD
jgi:hypothetical protein